MRIVRLNLKPDLQLNVLVDEYDISNDEYVHIRTSRRL